MNRVTLPFLLLAILLLTANSSLAQNLKQTWDWISRHNTHFKVPFEKFAADMKDDAKRYQAYQWLSSHHPDFTVSFEKFSINILEPSLCVQADSLSRAEEYERAIYLYTLMIDTKESCERAYFKRGSCKSSVGDHRGAISDLKTYLDSVKGLEHNGIEDDNTPFTVWYVQLAYLMIGNSYLALGNIEEGCLSYGKAGEYGSEEAYEYLKKSCN